MRGTGLPLPLTNPPPSFALFVSLPQYPPLRITTPIASTTRTSFILSPTSKSSSYHTKYRRWDSNAETFRTQNFNFNPNSNSQDEEDDEDDDDDDEGDWFEVLEEFIDGVWIFKAFRSYGWMLPAIISSLLLASGPKAFLIALALPLGQSALSLAFQKVWGRTRNKPNRKAKTKKKPRGRRTPNSDLEEEEEESQGTGTRKKTVGYQTWVAGNDAPIGTGRPDSPRFGGWDELDRRTNSNMRAARRSTRTADGPLKTQRSKLSRREGRSDMPLLLRLLIAVFPFLGSWTKML